MAYRTERHHHATERSRSVRRPMHRGLGLGVGDAARDELSAPAKFDRP